MREIFCSDLEGVVSDAKSDVGSLPDSGSCYEPSSNAGSSSGSGASIRADESDGEKGTAGQVTIEDYPNTRRIHHG